MNTRVFFRIACFLALTLASTGDLFARSRSSSTSASSGAFVWLFILGLLLFFAALVTMLYYLDRKRSDKIRAVATRLGFGFRRKATEADKTLIVGCQIANAGHSHITSNVLEVSRSEELRMTLFDHVYTTGYGKTSQQHNQTVTRMQSPVLNLPAFVLYPETFFSKIGKFFGGADINFPEAPQFSEKYILRGNDEAAIRSLFAPALRQFLEQQQSLSVDAAGDTLFVHRASRRVKPDEIEACVAEGKLILAKFFEAWNSSQPPTPSALPPPLPS